MWHLSLPLMNSFNKTEAAVFSFRPCFLRASLSSVYYNYLLSFIFSLPVVLSRAICSMLKPDPSDVGSANSVIVMVMLSADRLRRVPDVAHECATLAWHVPSCTHCDVAST